MDMRFFAFSKNGYELILRGMADSIREDLPVSGVAENHLRAIVGTRLKKDNIVPRFHVTPRVEGIQGNNKSYSGGLNNMAKQTVRDWGRRLIPKLWI